MELLTSRVLSAPHGFPTRDGGVSQGAFSSLNSSFAVGDEPERVEENLRRLERAARVDRDRLLTVIQVHSDRLVEARPGSAPVEADALWTSERAVAVGVRTADCLPVLLESDAGVAAVHAGWRGVQAEIVARAVAALGGASVVRVAVGPCIQRCCYEVSRELADAFAGKFGPEVVVPREAGRPHLDLVAALKVTLERLGVRPEAIDTLDACTSCDARFFSHRRDHARTGRHLSFISRP